MVLPLAADGLLQTQSGIATREQLRTIGVSISRLRAQLAAGRWRAVNESVVATHNGPLTRLQALWAVWLSATPPAAICAETALRLWGYSGIDSAVIHILVRKGARVLPTPGTVRKVHESRRFSSSDVWPVMRPVPVTSAARAAVDAATWTRAPASAVRILVNAVQQRLCTARELHAELDAAGAIRHSRLMRAVLVDIDGGAQAVSELAFLAFCARHGLPRPRLQVRFDSQGRRRYLDAEFTGPNGTPVRIEIDGGVHLTLAQRWRDTRNDNDLMIDGVVVLRFPSVAIHTDDPVAIGQIRRALRLVRG